MDDHDAVSEQFRRVRELLDRVADNDEVGLSLYRLINELLGLLAVMYQAATKPVMLDVTSIPGLADKVKERMEKKRAGGEVTEEAPQSPDDSLAARMEEYYKRAYL